MSNMNDELYHYGHKGMKWGESIFTEEDRARGRAVREAQKQERQRKAQLEAQKHELLLKAKKEKEERAIKSGNPNAQDHATTRPNMATEQEVQAYRAEKKQEEHKSNAHLNKVKEQIKKIKSDQAFYGLNNSEKFDNKPDAKGDNTINTNALIKDNLKDVYDESRTLDDRKAHLDAAKNLDDAQFELASKMAKNPESYNINDYRNFYSKYNMGVNDPIRAGFKEAARYNDPGPWYINAYKEMCKVQGREVEEIDGGTMAGYMISAKDMDHLPSGEEDRKSVV